MLERTGEGALVAFATGPALVRFGVLSDLRHGWAVTVHRAQGSEWPAVVAVVPAEAGGLLSRPLVYTALTRAQRHLTVVHAAGPPSRGRCTTSAPGPAAPGCARLLAATSARRAEPRGEGAAYGTMAAGDRLGVPAHPPAARHDRSAARRLLTDARRVRPLGARAPPALPGRQPQGRPAPPHPAGPLDAARPPADLGGRVPPRIRSWPGTGPGPGRRMQRLEGDPSSTPWKPEESDLGQPQR